ncbi:serine hydrolase domain-containing protein [Maribacter hydrothermalis]|uniref:Serine hydrolase n=1 Tax=Maribacter hydrothermalis TaxID=1836467 RepID=A0A1B7Z8K0_9FLAO|nr:serine hydrolase [Maribacter hydrothermalis]APQ18964.1 serine hydrolase [Maribacter hydrothermalis]OBR39023.1 serine hydrolase [Maribacter hydrothermalis]
MKKIKLLLGAAILAIIILAYFNYPKLNLISGYASKNMASNVFIADRDLVDVTLNDHEMTLINLSDCTVSENDKSAIATVFGLMPRTAVYKEGLGAVLTNNEFSKHNFNSVPHRTIIKNSLPFPFGNNGIKDTILDNVDYDKLAVAFSNAFKDSLQKTRSLLVVHKNEIIGEQYIRGFTKDTPILGWSMTKSVLATLYGILEYQGKMNMDFKPFSNEIQMKGLKSNITINHLLRMESGLAWDEDYFKISDVSRMLFLASDMTVAQRNNEIIAAPTEIWNYSSGTTNLLSGILREQFNTHQEYLDFPYQELIDKIGMNSMLLETDLVGNYVLSSYGWATTRDWAKFGLLYLNNGNWNGERLFSDSWVSYISKPTLNSNGTYGAHFWLNADGKYPDISKELYSVNGFQGQRIFIIPSKELVVVRTGLEEQTDEQFNTLLKEIIASIR